ncbi:MAG TPA: hypothetical protein VGL94_17855 [Ktedonobacteraceae bacterium]|jgi:hypothetical protein
MLRSRETSPSDEPAKKSENCLILQVEAQLQKGLRVGPLILLPIIEQAEFQVIQKMVVG